MIKKIFKLKRKDAKFSERQKMFIDYLIDSDKNWKNFKDLIEIKLVEQFDDSFVVQVVDTDTKWHSKFSNMLCQKASLDNLKLNSNSGDSLFDVEVLE